MGLEALVLRLEVRLHRLERRLVLLPVELRRARVTLGLQADGTPTGISVELPAGSTATSRACVEQAFRTVRVPQFDGTAVNVRRTFFVKA